MENEEITTKKNNKWFSYLFVIIIYISVFQNALESYIPIIKNFDEILAVAFFPCLIVRLINRKSLKIKKYDLIISLCLIGVLFVGLYANLKFQLQSMKQASIDILLIYKFFLVYFLFLDFSKNGLEENSKMIVMHLKIITIILFLFTLVNYVFKLYPGQERYGIMTNQIFYTQPTYLVGAAVFLLCTFIYFNKKINMIYIYILFFLIATTLRVKALGFLFVFMAIAIYVNKSNKKMAVYRFIVIAVICMAAISEQIEYYFVTIEDSARAVLLSTSFEIANDYVPIGTGFGTYASYPSIQNYSPIYAMYGIDKVYGLTSNNPSFALDSFWPMILGQFGYIGVLLYSLSIWFIFKKIQSIQIEENKYQYIAKITALAYLLISSTSETAFANQIAIPLAIILAL